MSKIITKSFSLLYSLITVIEVTLEKLFALPIKLFKRSYKKSFIGLMLFILMLFAAYYFVAQKRYNMLDIFWHNPEMQSTYFVDETPMVNTLDAYRWVRHAEEYKAGIYVGKDNDTLMYYPDTMERIPYTPLISVMIGELSDYFGGDLYETGFNLVCLFAGLFIIPLGIYFYRMGYPMVGIMGGLIGAFGTLYMSRSTPGRIDTDTLNMFFPILTSLLIYISVEQTKRRLLLILVALAGLSQLLFTLWYSHPLFILVYLGVLIATMLLYKKTPIDIILASIFFVIFSNPIFFSQSLQNFVSLAGGYINPPEVDVSGFPRVYNTISEASRSSATEVLSLVLRNPTLSVISLISFIAMCLLYPKKMLPLLPVVAMGFMAFISSLRFVMYLVPFAGIGLAYIVHILISYIPSKIFKKDIMYDITSYLVGALIILLLLSKNYITHTVYPQPSIDTRLYSSFVALREELPKDSVIYTWWDFGLAIEMESKMKTFHDGMNQGSLKTWLIAKSFVNDQDHMYKYLSYTANEGMSEINPMFKSKKSAPEIMSKIDNYTTPLKADDIYILFTQDMIGKYTAIQYIGGWDIVKNQATPTSGFNVIECTPNNNPNILQCNNAVIDIQTGLMNGKTPIKSIDFIDINNNVVADKKFGFTNGWHVVAYMDNYKNVYAIVVMEPNEYNSSFAQMYLLGNYDQRYFEEVINMFPTARVFRVKSGVEFADVQK